MPPIIAVIHVAMNGSMNQFATEAGPQRSGTPAASKWSGIFAGSVGHHTAASVHTVARPATGPSAKARLVASEPTEALAANPRSSSGMPATESNSASARGIAQSPPVRRFRTSTMKRVI